MDSDAQGGREMRTSRGFTLIELLAVIAIVVVLAAILFPVFGGARRKVLKVECQESMRSILCSVRLYAADYDGRLPADLERMSWADDELFWNREKYSCPVWSEVNDRGRGYGFNRLVNRMTLKQSVTGALAFIWDGKDITIASDVRTLDRYLAYNRHSPSGEKRVNMGFLDGRVEWRKAETISTELFAP